MQTTVALRRNMISELDPSTDHASRYRAALDMAAFADDHGFGVVNCEEHHCAANGWLPAPLTMAAAIAGRTRCSLSAA